MDCWLYTHDDYHTLTQKNFGGNKKKKVIKINNLKQ